jgi:hypothetical protein
MMIKRYYILLVFGLLFTSVFGQEDYVVTIKGDTLYGKLTFQQIGKIEQVKIKSDKNQTISSIQVREAKLKGITYRPVQFSGAVQMMQVIKDGYLSLLAFQPPGIMNYDGRLLMLRSGSILEVPSIGFKKHVSNFLSDNEALAARIQDGDFDKKDLDKIIDEFNSFIGKNTIETEQQMELESSLSPKLDAIDEILEAVRSSNMEAKSETLEMLTELKDKLSNDKSIPQYLSNALKENLKSQHELVKKLESVLKD